MKIKLIILSLIIAFVCMSAPAFAAYLTDSFNVGATLPLMITTSKNVKIEIQLGAAANPCNNYLIGSFHQTGSRTFGSSNKDSKLFYIDTTGTTVPDTISNASTFVPTWSGWSPL